MAGVRLMRVDDDAERYSGWDTGCDVLKCISTVLLQRAVICFVLLQSERGVLSLDAASDDCVLTILIE